MGGDMMMFPDTVEEYMEQYKVVDRDHAISNGAEFIPVFRMRQWFDHLQAPITNADRVRAMTDEELAAWLEDRTMLPINGLWLNWLKQEA